MLLRWRGRDTKQRGGCQVARPYCQPSPTSWETNPRSTCCPTACLYRPGFRLRVGKTRRLRDRERVGCCFSDHHDHYDYDPASRQMTIPPSTLYSSRPCITTITVPIIIVVIIIITTTALYHPRHNQFLERMIMCLRREPGIRARASPSLSPRSDGHCGSNPPLPLSMLHNSRRQQ